MEHDDACDDTPISSREGARLVTSYCEIVEDVDVGDAIHVVELWEWNQSYYVASWWVEHDEDGEQQAGTEPSWQFWPASTDDEAIASLNDPASWT